MTDDYQILYLGVTLVLTDGHVYLGAVSHFFWALYTLELCFLGLFALNALETWSMHSVMQAISIVITLAWTAIEHGRLSTMYQPLFQHPAIWNGEVPEQATGAARLTGLLTALVVAMRGGTPRGSDNDRSSRSA